MVQQPDSSCDPPHGTHVGCPSETSSTQRWCQPMSTRVGGCPLLPNIPANIWWWNLYPNHLQYIVSFNWSFSLVKIASRRSVSWRILLRSWKLHWKCHVLKEERHKHPAGSGMERVGVSNSLLGTYDQHWDLPVILSLAMMKNVFFGVFYLSGKQILSKCRYLHGCISGSRCVYFHSGVRFLLADLSCLQLGHLSATQLKQVIMLSMCESPLPTADTQRYLFWLRAEGLWNISFHLHPAVTKKQL